MRRARQPHAPRLVITVNADIGFPVPDSGDASLRVKLVARPRLRSRRPRLDLHQSVKRIIVSIPRHPPAVLFDLHQPPPVVIGIAPLPAIGLGDSNQVAGSVVLVAGLAAAPFTNALDASSRAV